MSDNIKNQEIKSLQKELLELLANSDEDKVIEKLVDFAEVNNSSSLTEALVAIRRKHKDLQSDILKGTISEENKGLQRSQITDKLTSLCSDLQSAITDEDEEKPEATKDSINTKIDKVLSLVFNYGYIVIFLVSIYIFVHFSIKMLFEDEYIDSFIQDFKYVPYIISFTGIAAASFLRTLSLSAKQSVEKTI